MHELKPWVFFAFKYHYKPQTCNNCKNICYIQQKDVIHRKHEIDRGKWEYYMFSEHVIFSPDKLHVRLKDYIRYLEITCFRYQIHLITETCNL